jgi:fibro-slime domain-containing protein
VLTGTIRDFLSAGTAAGTYNGHVGVGHPDFESFLGDDPGIVTGTLGPDGKPVYAGTAGNPSTHGQVAFDQWYRDTAGVNVSSQYSIALDDIGGGIFSYDNGDFFPIDGQGFADSDCCGHNYAFTYELATLFTYQNGQKFTFRGDDDVFVYINNALVIDLGGVHGAQSKMVALDSLGLTLGNSYPLDVFHAERHTTQSNFRIDTTICSMPM